MSQRLWLVFERAGHPDAVSYPATRDEVQEILGWLRQPETVLSRWGDHLTNWVQAQRRRPVACRPVLAMRRKSGLLQLVPWRCARWLALVFRAPLPVRRRIAARLQSWLERPAEGVQILRGDGAPEPAERIVVGSAGPAEGRSPRAD